MRRRLSAPVRPQVRLPGAVGTARVDPRTKNLTKRLRPGDIAVIDHVDIDRVSAEALVACQPAAVVNAAAEHVAAATRTSGRRSSSRPGIPLVDGVGIGRDDRARRRGTASASTAAASDGDGDTVRRRGHASRPTRHRRGGAGGGPRRAGRAARVVRGQHDGVPAQGARPAARRRRRARTSRPTSTAGTS